MWTKKTSHNALRREWGRGRFATALKSRHHQEAHSGSTLNLNITFQLTSLIVAGERGDWRVCKEQAQTRKTYTSKTHIHSNSIWRGREEEKTQNMRKTAQKPTFTDCRRGNVCEKLKPSKGTPMTLTKFSLHTFQLPDGRYGRSALFEGGGWFLDM